MSPMVEITNLFLYRRLSSTNSILIYFFSTWLKRGFLTKHTACRWCSLLLGGLYLEFTWSKRDIGFFLFICLFIYLFNKCLLSSYYVPETILSTSDTSVNKTILLLIIMYFVRVESKKWSFSWRGLLPRFSSQVQGQFTHDQ